MLLGILMVASFGAVLAASPPYPYPFLVKCQEPRVCTPDLIPWCIVGQSKPVYGHCAVQDAICSGADLDLSNSCFLPYGIDCEGPADDRECMRDLRPWCLEGRAEPVLGHCAIQEAICDENAVLDTSGSCLP